MMPDFKFDSLADFFAMGGYGFFVWIAYGFFALFVFWCVYMPKVHRRNIVRLIRARKQRDAAMQARVSKPINESN